MYPSFSEDRKELSNRAVIAERKNISIKRKRRFMLIFSKENLVAGFILARPLITKSVFYMRSGGKARLFFIYSDDEKNAVEIIGESNKDNEDEVIENLKKNFN